MYYVFGRGMDRGADGGGVGEIAREMRVVLTERDEYDGDDGERITSS